MALSLTASHSDYLDITSGLEAFPCNEPWTICGWIYLRTEPTGDGFYFYSHSADDSYANGDIFNITSSSVVRLTTADEDHHSGGLEDHSGATFLNTDQWYFFAAVYDGAGVEVSIDLNVEITSTLTLDDRDGITKMVLGNYVGGGSFFADMRFWGWKAFPTDLDSVALAEEMTQGHPVASGEWAAWDFEPTARPNDDSGNGHHWTEHGSPGDEDPPPGVPLEAGTTVTPGTASLTTTKFTPTVNVSDHKTVVPGTLNQTVTRFTPTVTASDHQSVTPGTFDFTVTRFTPTVETGVRVIPGTGGLTITLLIPTEEHTAHNTVIPGKTDLIVTRFAPTVSSSTSSIEPGTLRLGLTMFAPSVESTTPLSVMTTGFWSSVVLLPAGSEWRVTATGASCDAPQLRLMLRFIEVPS